MPVGTQGAVKALTPAQLEDAGSESVPGSPLALVDVPPSVWVPAALEVAVPIDEPPPSAPVVALELEPTSPGSVAQASSRAKDNTVVLVEVMQRVPG